MKYLSDGISLQNKRQTNMDSLLLTQRVIDGAGSILAVVCDGVGSLEDGDFASCVSARMLGQWYKEQTATQHIGLRMRDEILRINSCVTQQAKECSLDTAATLSALLIVQETFYIVHAGDSRIYSFENGARAALTYDDTTETGALTTYIGKADDIVLQYAEGTAQGKTFLVCSDGVYKHIDMDYLDRKVAAWTKRPSKKIIKSIVKYVIEHGEQDNITMALVKILK